MATGPEHYRQAEQLLAQAHHYTYGDGADPATGHALATDAIRHALLATQIVVAELCRLDRAANFRAAADAIEQEQAREERAERERFGWLDKEARLQGEAVRAKAAFLRRLAEDVEREKGTSGSTQPLAGESTPGTPESAGAPLIVCRYDVVIEPAPEEEPVLTVGAVAEDGRPVALLFDRESRRRVAGWLAPGLTEGGT
ncbi:hypothetical protein [Streptomyces murinus]